MKIYIFPSIALGSLIGSLLFLPLPRPTDIQELKERIRRAFDDVTREMRQATLLQYRYRLQKLIEIEGGHVEVHITH